MKARAHEASEELLTIADVAVRWKMHYETIRRWCEKGALRAVRVGPSKAIRISRTEVERHEE